MSKQCRPRSAASDLGLHCLSVSILMDTKLIWVKGSQVAICSGRVVILAFRI